MMIYLRATLCPSPLIMSVRKPASTPRPCVTVKHSHVERRCAAPTWHAANPRARRRGSRPPVPNLTRISDDLCPRGRKARSLAGSIAIRVEYAKSDANAVVPHAKFDLRMHCGAVKFRVWDIGLLACNAWYNWPGNSEGEC